MRVRRSDAEPLLMLYGAGHERRDQRYYFDSSMRKDRRHVNLQLTIGGLGMYRSRRGTFELPPGFAYIDVIPGDFEYGTMPWDSKGMYEHVFVSMSGVVAEHWCRRIVWQFGNILDLSAAAPVQEQMLWIARRHECDDLPDRYLLSARLNEIVMSIMSSLSTRRVQTTPRVRRAIQLMLKFAGDSKFQVEALAEQLGCSREHLSRQFQATMHMSPTEYLTTQRLKLAAGMLRCSETKLEAIARRCGLSSANYLCRVFRQRVGLTPAEFRRCPWLTVR